MLWAYSHKLTNVLHISEYVTLEDRGFSFGWHNKSSKHRDRCGLACTILAKQCKNLSLEHFNVNALHRLESICVSLLKSIDLKELIIKLEFGNISGNRLIVLRLEIPRLKVIDY